MSNGKECQCAARSEFECACGADWTPEEVYALRAENARLIAQSEGLQLVNIKNVETFEKEIAALQAEKDAWQGRFYAADGKLSEHQQDVQTTADALGSIQRQFESVSQDRDDWIACHAKIFRELQETKTLLANKCAEFDYFIDAAIKDRDYFKKDRDELQAKLSEQTDVPDGWKLVPLEPTKKMQKAALSTVDDAFGVGIYKAMLAAAPTPKGEPNE